MLERAGSSREDGRHLAGRGRVGLQQPRLEGGVLVSRRSRSLGLGEVARLVVDERAECGCGPGQAEQRDGQGRDAARGSRDEPDSAEDRLGTAARAGDADLQAVAAGPRPAAHTQGDQRPARRSCAARSGPTGAARGGAPRLRCASGGAGRCAPACACGGTGRGGAWRAGCWRRAAATRSRTRRRWSLRHRPSRRRRSRSAAWRARRPPSPRPLARARSIVTPESVSEEASDEQLDVGVVVLGHLEAQLVAGGEAPPGAVQVEGGRAGRAGDALDTAVDHHLLAVGAQVVEPGVELVGRAACPCATTTTRVWPSMVKSRVSAWES